jgi:hypothetical protein
MDPMAAAASVTFSGRGSRLLAATDSWPDLVAAFSCAGELDRRIAILVERDTCHRFSSAVTMLVVENGQDVPGIGRTLCRLSSAGPLFMSCRNNQAETGCLMSHDDPREVYRALRGQLEPMLRYLAKLQVRTKTRLPPGDDLCHRVDAVLEAMLALHGEVCDRAGNASNDERTA